MLIRVGYEISYSCAQPVPMLLCLSLHDARRQDVVASRELAVSPDLPMAHYRDIFGNTCTRVTAPIGVMTLTADAVVLDSGAPDPVVPRAPGTAVENLPASTMAFLLGSRYCETDLLVGMAWDLFGGTVPGWPRVQAICDYVHGTIEFGYHHARSTKGAADALREGQGVCRDFAHAAIALCRCMNIPARYCTGYLGDIGVRSSGAPMDFSAWFEAWIDGRWYTFDARHNVPRIGRVLMARGRDASDAAISNSFGPNELTGFKVWTFEVAHERLEDEDLQALPAPMI
ncbi:MAG: transglutaminase family protein [Pseudoxanthomonas sp.]